MMCIICLFTHSFCILNLEPCTLPPPAGLLVAYTRRLDIDLRLPLRLGYFLPTAVGYGCGLMLT